MPPIVKVLCPVCHGLVPLGATKCRHCHHFLGYSAQWAWEEGARMLGLVAMVAAVLVAAKSLEMSVTAERDRQAAVAEADLSHRERLALQEDLAAGTATLSQLKKQLDSAPEKSLLKASSHAKDPRVKLLFDQALQLKRENRPFIPGGKAPDEGFDNSGFVSYLLGLAGALDPHYQRAYSVTRLERALVSVEAKDARPGDLVFIGKGFVAIYLGTGQALAMSGAIGIQVFSLPTQASASYRRWAYEAGIKMLR